jgi:hypothetical protein
MSGPNDAAGWLEGLARLCVALEDPSLPLGPFLADLGLDPQAWAQGTEAALAQLSTGEEPATELGRRFADARAKARARVAHLATPPAEVPAPAAPQVQVPTFLMAQPATLTPAAGYAEAPTEPEELQTQPVDITEIRRRSLPFDSSARSPLAVASAAPAEACRGRDSAHADETVTLSLDSGRRRLVRFEPETGRPLAQPYWEIVPVVSRKS